MRTLAREGQSIAEPERVSLGSIVTRSWEMVEAPGATLSVEDDVALRADPDRLSQLLENLLRNAVEHGSTSSRPGTDDAVTHGGGTVSIRIGAIGERGFYVADDGPGIPEGEREAIFDSGHSTTPEGTGLGLSIVAEIVEAHGWQVRAVESETGGARFEITGVAVVDAAEGAERGPGETGP